MEIEKGCWITGNKINPVCYLTKGVCLWKLVPSPSSSVLLPSDTWKTLEKQATPLYPDKQNTKYTFIFIIVTVSYVRGLENVNIFRRQMRMTRVQLLRLISFERLQGFCQGGFIINQLQWRMINYKG